jgi:translation initiation factor 6
MHIDVSSYNGNPNIGLFCFANNKYCLVPFGFSEKEKKKYEKALKVPIYEMRAAGTSLLGVFFTGNDDILLVPKIMFDTELKRLDELKIKYQVVESELTALGNNLLVLNNNCIANPDFSEDAINSIKKNKINVKLGKINELNTVGSLAKGTSQGMIVSDNIKDFEIKFIEKNLKVSVTKGSLNFGSQYVASAFFCNDSGFIVGDVSTGPEIQNADIALGFMEE